MTLRSARMLASTESKPHSEQSGSILPRTHLAPVTSGQQNRLAPFQRTPLAQNTHQFTPASAKKNGLDNFYRMAGDPNIQLLKARLSSFLELGEKEADLGCIFDVGI